MKQRSSVIIQYCVFALLPDGADPIGIQSQRGFPQVALAPPSLGNPIFPSRSSKPIRFTPPRSPGRSCTASTRCFLPSPAAPAHLSVFPPIESRPITATCESGRSKQPLIHRKWSFRRRHPHQPLTHCAEKPGTERRLSEVQLGRNK